MVFRKRKRQIEYCGEIFYWFVRKNENNLPRIHILSEDKRINLEYPLIDTEVPVTPKEVERLLDMYFKKFKIIKEDINYKYKRQNMVMEDKYNIVEELILIKLPAEYSEEIIFYRQDMKAEGSFNDCGY